MYTPIFYRSFQFSINILSDCSTTERVCHYRLWFCFKTYPMSVPRRKYDMIVRFCFNVCLVWVPPCTQNVSRMHIRCSKDVQGLFWTSYVRSINVLCLGSYWYKDKPADQPFNAWCLLKGHTYLNKLAAFSCRLV